GDLVELKSFDMCERLPFGETRYWFQCSVSAGVDDHICSSQLARCPVRKSSLDCFGPDEASGPENQFRTALFVVLQIDVIPARHHPAFPFANLAHINGEVSVDDPELATSPEVRG